MPTNYNEEPQFRIKAIKASVDLIKFAEKSGIEKQSDIVDIGLKILKSKMIRNNVFDDYYKSQRFTSLSEIRRLKKKNKYRKHREQI